jgi:hypothetical protein
MEIIHEGSKEEYYIKGIAVEEDNQILVEIVMGN